MEPKFIIRSDQLVNIFNRFPKNYHVDYRVTRALARDFLYDEEPDYGKAKILASKLSEVLINWKAGSRKAPNLKNPECIQEVLMTKDVYKTCSVLNMLSIKDLLIKNGVRQISGKADLTPEQIDRFLIATIKNIANHFFINCTNVTYPMKALLLITGFIPALDGNVRKGFKTAGIGGLNSTRFLLPKNVASLEGKKITRLPYILAECFNTYSCDIWAAVEKSEYSDCLSEVGRIFDVLLFMQGAQDNPIKSIYSVGSKKKWYTIS